MTLIHYAGMAAVPLLISGYLAAIRWATRTGETPPVQDRRDV